MTYEDREDLLIAASLHNLGHIGTPDSLLQQEPVTTEDRLIFQAHAERGARILAATPELRSAADIVRFHHENFDGTGYPRGLTAEQIPLACRIIRVAQEYDLLTRPKAPLVGVSHEQAVSLLRERAGAQCDPRILEMAAQLNLPELDNADEATGPIPAIEAMQPTVSLPVSQEAV